MVGVVSASRSCSRRMRKRGSPGRAVLDGAEQVVVVEPLAQDTRAYTFAPTIIVGIDFDCAARVLVEGDD